MNIFSELKVGDKLSVEIREADVNQNESNILNAQLIDIDANYLYISPPIYRGKRYSLRKNQKITMFFYRKKGVYQFDAEVVSQTDINIMTFALKPLGDTQKIQRRNYYRLPMASPAVLKKQQSNKIVEFECIMKDLSGGGVRLFCKYEIEKLENVIIDLYIDGKQPVTMNGEVVRVIKNIEHNTYELGIKFKETNEIDTDRIFAFIFEQQRLMRKKGLM